MTNRNARRLESFTANGSLYNICACFDAESSDTKSGNAECAGGKILGRGVEIIFKLTNCDTSVGIFNYFCTNL